MKKRPEGFPGDFVQLFKTFGTAHTMFNPLDDSPGGSIP